MNTGIKGKYSCCLHFGRITVPGREPERAEKELQFTRKTERGCRLSSGALIFIMTAKWEAERIRYLKKRERERGRPMEKSAQNHETDNRMSNRDKVRCHRSSAGSKKRVKE